MKKFTNSTFSKQLVKKVHKIKNMKLLGFIMMICIISAGIFMQSCGRYDDTDFNTSMPYLELSNFDGVSLSAYDMNVLEKARTRMDKYVSMKDGVFQTSLKSGEQINISEQLFSILSNTMEQTNRQILEDPTILSLSYTPRLKSGVENGENGYSSSWFGYTFHLNNQTAKNLASYLIQGAIGSSGVTGILAAVGKLSKPVAIATTVVNSYAALIGESISNNNNGNGVSITFYSVPVLIGSVSLPTPFYSCSPR